MFTRVPGVCFCLELSKVLQQQQSGWESTREEQKPRQARSRVNVALKLDNNFPEVYLNSLLTAINKDIKQPFIKSPLPIEETEAGIQNQLEYVSPNLKKQLDDVLKRINNDFKGGLNNSSYVQIKKALLEIDNERNSGFTPWNKEVSAIGGLMNALQFGADQGQIRQLSDNNHIIALYCYGIGTYDFNLSDLKPLANFANTESYREVKKYFNK